jgi:hypothetical protein
MATPATAAVNEIPEMIARGEKSPVMWFTARYSVVDATPSICVVGNERPCRTTSPVAMPATVSNAANDTR